MLSNGRGRLHSDRQAEARVRFQGQGGWEFLSPVFNPGIKDHFSIYEHEPLSRVTNHFGLQPTVTAMGCGASKTKPGDSAKAAKTDLPIKAGKGYTLSADLLAEVERIFDLGEKNEKGLLDLSELGNLCSSPDFNKKLLKKLNLKPPGEVDRDEWTAFTAEQAKKSSEKVVKKLLQAYEKHINASKSPRPTEDASAATESATEPANEPNVEATPASPEEAAPEETEELTNPTAEDTDAPIDPAANDPDAPGAEAADVEAADAEAADAEAPGAEEPAAEEPTAEYAAESAAEAAEPAAEADEDKDQTKPADDSSEPAVEPPPEPPSAEPPAKSTTKKK